MKKTLVTGLALAFIGTLFVTGSALAQPLYSGVTTAVVGNNPAKPTATGYYVWSNETRTEWSVRWTGNNNGDTENLNWAGAIGIISPLNLDSSSVTTVQYEDNDGEVIADLGISSDEIIFGTAHAGPAWDGFNFSIGV